jgi:hypothetical protein
MCSVNNDTIPQGRAMSKKYIAVGLLAGLTAGTGAGFILQQTGSAGASSSALAQPTDDDDSGTTVTTDSGTTDTGTNTERPDPSARLSEVLAPLVADNTLTQAQADAVVKALVAARPIGGGHGPGRHHGPRGLALETVASVLGITVGDLRTQLQNGATLAEVAGDKTQAVIDALVAEATAHIEQGVTYGRITRAEADARLADLVDRITERVNSPRPARPLEVDSRS